MFFSNANRETQYHENEKGIRSALTRSGLSDGQINKTLDALKQKIQEVDLPKIAIIGFTGVGKSTTLNALFNAGQATSEIRACTQSETPIIGDVEKYTGSKGSIILYDMPGLGEDIQSDKRHLETYRKVLPIVDVAVWTFHTGDRAMTPMQNALNKLTDSMGKDFSDKLMFAINKADAIAPGESAWNRELNSPSREQRKNITELEMYVKEKVRQVMPAWNGKIVTYSARTRYHLEQLMGAMIETMPRERRWVLDSVSDVADPRALMNEQYRVYVEEKMKEMNGGNMDGRYR